MIYLSTLRGISDFSMIYLSTLQGLIFITQVIHSAQIKVRINSVQLKYQPMNFFNNVQEQYEQLWKYIIRPTRATYPEKNLGPQTFELQGRKIKRVDFQLVNPRGYVLYCSHFIPLHEQTYPCVIYMHGNSSNRTEGMEYLGDLMRQNFSLCTFDFSGCGNSEGDYVSLGYFQQDDLNQVVQYIRKKPSITSIAIWGRSMGAVTALLYLRKSKYISAAIFDSPFKSLKSLIEDLCRKNSKIPQLIIAGALKIIAGTIQQKAKFDIYKLNPLKYEVPFLKYPAFFIVGMQDDMIPPDHTVTLFQQYKGDNKQLQRVVGNHNDARPEQCVQNIILFLLENLQTILVTNEAPDLKSRISKKQQQFNFFDDETQIQNSSKQTQNFDFFADEKNQAKQAGKFENFELTDQNTGSKYSNTQKFTEKHTENPTEKSTEKFNEKPSDIFSFTPMMSSVFGAGNVKKQQNTIRGQDGYENTIQRISKQFLIQNTNIVRRAKQAKKSWQQNIKSDVNSAMGDNFERQILANLQSWAF